MTETSLRTISKSLVNHSDDLAKINDFALKIKKKYEDDLRKEQVTSRKKELYIFTIEEALGLIGDMSRQAFDTYPLLEQVYAKKYTKSPKLGKKLFLDHYQQLHKPYDQVKNRLWKILLRINNVEENED